LHRLFLGLDLWVYLQADLRARQTSPAAPGVAVVAHRHPVRGDAYARIAGIEHVVRARLAAAIAGDEFVLFLGLDGGRGLLQSREMLFKDPANSG
jgi:hypothetical protein